jgi:hypothetical protein
VCPLSSAPLVEPVDGDRAMKHRELKLHCTTSNKYLLTEAANANDLAGVTYVHAADANHHTHGCWSIAYSKAAASRYHNWPWRHGQCRMRYPIIRLFRSVHPSITENAASITSCLSPALTRSA